MSNHIEDKQTVPLVVDLDGSVLWTDTLLETAILFIKSKPWMVFHLIFWLIKGKNVLKRELAHRTNLDVKSLPVRSEVIEYIQNEHATGRNILLCTGSWNSIAQDFSELYPFFDEVIATDESINLTGGKKLTIISKRFSKFDYLGNEKKDLLIWKSARKAIVVGSDALARQARDCSNVDLHFKTKNPSLHDYLKLIRIHQWAKNALLFVPLVTAHKAGNFDIVLSVVLAFLSFGFCASATYILNDLFDLEADRNHKTKKYRPIASGAIGISASCLLSIILMILAVFIAVFVNDLFIAALLFYAFLTSLYSFRLKKLQTIDVIVLASLFTIRVISGAIAIEVPLSFWLLSFSMFLFISLAILKRVSEIMNAERQSNSDSTKILGRGYFTADIIILQCLGSSAGFISVLVLALYINSNEVIQLYNYPQTLWLVFPIFGYWIMRMWMLAARGEMNEDPISFAIKDRNSLLAAVLLLAIISVSSLL